MAKAWTRAESSPRRRSAAADIAGGGRSFAAAGEPAVVRSLSPFGGATLDAGVFVG